MRQSSGGSTIARPSLGSARGWVKARRGSSLWFRAALGLLFVAVVGSAGAIALLGRFDGLYGQDPYAYFDYAIGPLAASLRHWQLPPPFYWPPGYPLLISLVSLAVGAVPRAGQLVSLLDGGLVPVFTALLASEAWSADLFDHAPGSRPATSGRNLVMLVAGLAVALSGQLWQSSVVVMADTTGLALACAGICALVRFGRVERGHWLVLAAAALSYAVVTRWAYALVAIPASVFAAWLIVRCYRPRLLLALIAAAVVSGLILGPVLAPAIAGLLAGASGNAPFATDLFVYSWSPLNAARRAFATADGLLQYRLPNGLYYLLAPLHAPYLSPLVAWLVVPGLWSVFRRRRAAGLLIVGWAGVVYAFHAGAPWQNVRFVLAYLPPLAILAGFGAATIAPSIPLPLSPTSGGNGSAPGGSNSSSPLVGSEADSLSESATNLSFRGPPPEESRSACSWETPEFLAAARNDSMRPAVRHDLPKLSTALTMEEGGARGRGSVGRVDHRSILSAVLAAVVVLGMLTMVVDAVALTRGFVERKDVDLATVHWLQERVPANAVLLTFGFTLTASHYTTIETVDLSETDPTTLADFIHRGRPTFVFVDQDNLETQWQGRAPSTNLRWLADGPGLDRIGASQDFTLFRVRPGATP